MPGNREMLGDGLWMTMLSGISMDSSPLPPADPPPLPVRRPSIRSRFGMTGLTVLPSLFAVGLLWAGLASSSSNLTVSGGGLGVIVIGLVVLAQSTPPRRNAAMLTMGVVSVVILVAGGLAIIGLGVFFAICSVAAKNL
jgi:hypothetical protein